MKACLLGRLVGAAASALVATVMFASPAAAEVSGSCDALIKGISAHDRSSTDPAQAIKVEADEVVPYSVASSAGVTSRRFLMEYAGVRIVVDKGTSKGNSDFASGAAAVKDYAWLGAGLYKVIGEAALKDGSTCSGAVLVDVGGNPLTTALGIGGVIAVVTGLIGVVVASGTRSGELIDELVGFVTGPNAPDPATAAATGGGVLAPVAGGGRRDPSEEGSGEENAGAIPGQHGPPEEEETGKRKPPRRGGVPVDPVTLAGGAVGGESSGPGGTGEAGAGVPPVGPTGRGGRGGITAGAHEGPGGGETPGEGAGSGGGTESGDPPGGTTGGGSAATGGGDTEAGEAGEDPKPPPLPGMGFVTGTGEKADALIKAHETLTEAIGQLPISEEQQEKLTETLGLEKIKEKLDSVKEVTDTITHFEEVGTETVDTLNRWGVPPRMVEAILWFRWTTEASGRATQKFTDAIVTPVLTPVTEALGEVGVEADAEEVAHAILPFQEAAEEASKAAMTTVKNVLGGQQAIDQRAQGGYEEEWDIVRPRW